MGAPTFLDLARSIDRQLQGNINFPYRVLSGVAESIDDTDFYLAVDATANNIAITLPDASTVKAGMPYWLLRVDGVLAKTVTITGTGGQTINGAASVFMVTQYAALQIVSDGSNWLLFASPSSFALSSDVLWALGGQLSTDQNDALFDLKAKRAMAFVALDAEVRVAPTGSDILIDWSINGGVDVANRVTIAAGAYFGQTIIAVALEVDDVMHPTIVQVGSTTPGQTIVMRARGI